jgi:hypothetical protein
VKVIIQRSISIECGRMGKGGTKSTYHFGCVPRLLQRFLMMGTRKVTAVVVLERSFGFLTTANWTCLNGRRRIAFGLKPPIPASRSVLWNATRMVGAQGTTSARSHTVTFSSSALFAARSSDSRNLRLLDGAIAGARVKYAATG